MTVLLFPASRMERLTSTVTILHLDGRQFASAGFLHGNPGDAWNWIAETVAAELGCSPEEVHSLEGEDGDDTVGVDGLPCYRVEILRPRHFMR